MARFSPVVLIAGAASAAGAACARAMAGDASGGLLLVDSDEAGLEAASDAIQHPPERVSTLAFDPADAERWAAAADFIRAQYGRLDWVIACFGATQRHEGAPVAALGVLRAVGPLIRANTSGGAVTLVITARSVKADALLRLVRVAAKEGSADNVRVNAVLSGAIESPLWRRDPDFETMTRAAGNEASALAQLERLSPPLAKCGEKQDVARLAHLLLSDEAGVSGVTLVADSGYTV